MVRHHSHSALFAARVVVTNDKTFLCISLLVPANGGSKAYPLTEAQIDSKVLDDIVATIVPTASSASGTVVSPLVSRLQALEQQVATMNATLLALAAERNAPKAGRKYGNRYAIVVANNSNAEGSIPPLQFAVSDGKGMAATLKENGFQVTFLENPTVTQVIEAIDKIGSSIGTEDLLTFFFAGSSVRATDIRKDDPENLFLITHDFSVKNFDSGLTLQHVVERMLALRNQDNLLLLDGCYGTSGLDRAKLSQMLDNGDVLQIFAASQDDGYGMENPKIGGGVFTQTLLKDIASMRASGTMSVSNIAATVTKNVVDATSAQQQPKLLTVGDGDIRF
jgi:hypothetical protein